MIIVSLDLSMNGTGCCKKELDDDLNVINKTFLGFTSVKKNAKKFKDGESIHYKQKDFKFSFDKYLFMEKYILQFCKGADYICIEDYAYGAKGTVFQIGEFVGGVKKELYKLGYKIRLYEPTTIKMFWTNHGTANKDAMINKYRLLKEEEKFSFTDEDCTKHPFEDVIDAVAGCELLRIELKLRKGLIELKSLTEKQIQVFNKVSKKNDSNLLVRDFIQKEKGI